MSLSPLQKSAILARPRSVAVLLIILWGLATSLIFIRLERRSESEIDSLATALKTRFKVSWIYRPDDENNQHLFRSMREEYFEELAAGPRFFRSVFLTWVHPATHQEVVLYPPQWIGRKVEELVTRDTLRKPLMDRFHQPEGVSGFLYFQLDPWQKRATPVTFLLAAVNVLLLLLILLYWLSRLNRRFEATRSELEQKKIELIQLEQLALAGRLTAGLLHDLKKPVIHIREECREGIDSSRLEDIREQSDLFLTMLRDSGLEDFARRRTSEPECCDVIDLLERSLRLVEYERNDVQVRMEVEGEIPFVWALPTRIMQVFSNIILNAYQAMQGRGALFIQVTSRQEGSNGFASVEISDTGPGIPHEQREDIFTPFFSTNKQGSGLGLYIAQTILQDLGGSITLVDSSTQGATFRILIPGDSSIS